MGIKYICYDCRRKVDLCGTPAVNNVGRKYCDICGSNTDTLQVINEVKFKTKLRESKVEI